VKKILAPRVWFLPFYGTRCILAINIDRWVTTSLGYIDTAFCSNEVINILYKLMYVQFILVYMPKVNESVQCIHQHKQPGTFVEIGLCMQTGLRYNYDICLILSPRIRPPADRTRVINVLPYYTVLQLVFVLHNRILQTAMINVPHWQRSRNNSTTRTDNEQQRWSPVHVGVVTRSVWPRSSIEGSILVHIKVYGNKASYVMRFARLDDRGQAKTSKAWAKLWTAVLVPAQRRDLRGMKKNELLKEQVWKA